MIIKRIVTGQCDRCFQDITEKDSFFEMIDTCDGGIKQLCEKCGGEFKK